MKKLTLLMLAAVLLMSLAACRPSPKPSEPASQSAAQTSAESVSPPAASVSGSNAAATDSAPTGDTSAASDTGGWPNSELGNAVPAFTKGSVMNVMDTKHGFIVALEKVVSADYDAYLSTIKRAFSENGTEANDTGIKTYVGSNSEGIKVSLIYDENAETLNVMVERGQ